MLVFVVILLALVPAAAMLYPFLRTVRRGELDIDESAPHMELERRWDAAMAGLKNTELEWTIGNLTEEDYAWLRDQYTTEAALLMKAMDMDLERQAPSAPSAEQSPTETCPDCSTTVERTDARCSTCGHIFSRTGSEGMPDSSSVEPPGD